MKRINWFKTIGLSAASIAAVTPMVVMSTSCAVTSTTVDSFTYAKLKEAATGTSGKFDNYSTGSVSFEKLLIGDLRITDGNFMIIVGSNANKSTCKFFSGDEKVRRKEDWFSSSYFTNSTLAKGITDDEKIDKEKVPFTIFNFVDYCPKEYYDNAGKRLYLSTDGKSPNLDYINPFKKWDASLIDNTYRYNAHERTIGGGTYEWDKESVTADKDYVRNDTFAVAYRTFNELGAKLYPIDEKAKEPRKTTFSTKDEDATRLVIFKDGVLKHLEAAPSDGKSFAELINKYFIKDEEEKK